MKINKVDFLRKCQGFVKKKKEEYCALKTSLVSKRSPSLFMSSSYETISDWLTGAILTACFLWGTLIGQCQKWCPDDRIWEKLFTESELNVEWAKLWVKSIKTLFEFAAKLFNLDEKVIWSFLTLIVKNINLMKKELWALLASGSHF